MESFDLEDLTNLEQAFYDKGHQEGYDHGRIHGLIEGRALGCEKGFEIWEEVGFYKGFALFWSSVYSTRDPESRAMTHITHLLGLIADFPLRNPSPDGSGMAPTTSDSGHAPAVTQDPAPVDITKMLTQIRSKYRALCSTLGVKPRLRAATAQLDHSPNKMSESDDNPFENSKPVNSIWKLNKAQKHGGNEDLTF
ncbi:hypothetical protein FRC02_003366 [Tulasnella sp. 418]|nr:hypothetical protein FRC02_003366 [Tulasnella sp. 418]